MYLGSFVPSRGRAGGSYNAGVAFLCDPLPGIPTVVAYRPLMYTDVVTSSMAGVAFLEDLLPGILQNTTGRGQWL